MPNDISLTETTIALIALRSVAATAAAIGEGVGALGHLADIDDDALAGPADALQVLQGGGVGNVVCRCRLAVE